MEDARASTSSQSLATTFDTIIESPEADITTISVVRPESLSTGNNRDIPVLVQELEVHGARKDRRTSEGLDTHVLQRTSPTDENLVEKPKHVIRGPEEEFGPREGKQPSGSSPSLHKQKHASTSAKQAQGNPKDQPEGQAKGKGKSKAQVEQGLPAELQDSQEREDSHGQCFQYGKNSDGIQKQERGNIEPIFSKEVDLLKLTFKRIKNTSSKLGSSTGNNAAPFQEQLEKSDKATLELKEDIQSIINNISLKNDLSRQSTPVLDRNVLNLNNDLHHTISSSAEVETACNFKEIPSLEEWPTFSGEGE
ncbi:hypothetical protein O181_087348 [Austropuccinia psidii MF-1]|uniref:Uncharacterized protein n=1 Tax=Austropuccinia psidii MF-1 TaxID=1389203 RepID=A0A9Q3IPH2_9BASI|nr:hypothetical protein [Austropuccinia psidii MF-1]